MQKSFDALTDPPAIEIGSPKKLPSLSNLTSIKLFLKLLPPSLLSWNCAKDIHFDVLFSDWIKLEKL